MSLGNKQIMAENIKRLLEQKGLNPRQMAIELGFKYTTVNDWVNAKSYPRIDKIETMANFFNVSKSALVEEYNPASDNISMDNNIDKQISKYYTNIKKNKKENGYVFNETAFNNAVLAWKSAPYLALDQYILELIVNSNNNNVKQVLDKQTLEDYFEKSIEVLKIGQKDERVPRELKEYLGVLSKQYEEYLDEIAKH